MESPQISNQMPMPIMAQPAAIQPNLKMMPAAAAPVHFKMNYEDVKINYAAPAYTAPAYTAPVAVSPYSSAGSILVLYVLLVIITRTYKC